MNQKRNGLINKYLLNIYKLQKIKNIRKQYEERSIFSIFSSFSIDNILNELDPSTIPYLSNKEDNNYVSL